MSRLAWVFVALLSCAGDAQPPGECLDDADCDGVAVCSEDFECVTVTCLDSSQCGLEQYCLANQCFTGCAEDTDCLGGFTCDTERYECVLQTCTDTQIDCSYGERCSTDTQECEAPDELCSSCDGPGWQECSDRGGQCRYGGGSYYCHTACEEGDEAPRQFTCESGQWYGDCGDVVNGSP